MKTIRTNTVDMQHVNIEKNQIRLALSNILRELEELTTTDENLRDDVLNKIKKTEATKSAKITGKGNINLQGLSGNVINVQINPKKGNRDYDRSYILLDISKSYFLTLQ